MALTWNAALLEPQKLLLVVQGTGVLPAPCAAVQPAGSAPVGVALKFSASRVVAWGVPLLSEVRNWPRSSPPSNCPRVTIRRLIGVPALNAGDRRTRYEIELCAVSPGLMRS